MALSPASIFAAALPVFLIVVLGWLLRKLGKMTAAADDSIIFLTVGITYPAFILHKILGDNALHDLRNLLIPSACGAGFMLLGLLVAWGMAPWFGLRERSSRGTFAVACSIQNYGYLPIPILAGLFPDNAWAGILFVFSLGVELVLWTVGVMVLSGSARGAGRSLFNPVVLSILIGITVNFLGWDAGIPHWFLRLLEMLGNCSFPLGLLLFGAALADLLKLEAWHHQWRTSVGAVLLRLGLLPLMMVAIALWIAPGEHLRHIISVQAAMPAAMFPLVMAKRYGGDEATAMRVILFTTLVSFATIPFAVQAAMHWLTTH